MPGFISSLLIITAVVVVLGATLGWMAFRRIKRVVARGRRRALAIRSTFVSPGPRHDAAVLRRQLAAELESLRHTMALAPGARIFQADPARVLAEAVEYAANLDHELAMIETFPDRAHQQAALDAIRPQVRTLIETVYSARHTMLRTAASDRERGLAGLSETVAHEAASLRNYERAKRGFAL